MVQYNNDIMQELKVWDIRDDLKFRFIAILVAAFDLVISCFSVVRVSVFYLGLGEDAFQRNFLLTLFVFMTASWMILLWWYAAFKLYLSTNLDRSVTNAITDVQLWRRMSIILFIVFSSFVLFEYAIGNVEQDVYHWHEVALMTRVIFIFLVHQYLTELQSVEENNNFMSGSAPINMDQQLTDRQSNYVVTVEFTEKA